jgi:uncharacterized caspase-like protein
LRFPKYDAEALAKILDDKETCGFEPYVHVNKPSHEVLEDLYDMSSQLTESDTLLFYYSGHGMLRHGNELYLGSSDTRLAKLNPSINAAEVTPELVRLSPMARIIY